MQEVSGIVEPRVEVGVLSAIGNTPLIELRSLSAATGRRIFAKCEWLNPAGSVKDRTALFLVRDLERRGLLKSGGTVVEGTGGNTGIGLALIAAACGYATIVCMPETIAREKIEMMRTLGATVVLCPSVPFTDERHYFHEAARLAAATEGAVCTQQFESLANQAAHIATTGPEIWKQTGGAVNGFVCAAGTGGTLAGVGSYLKGVSEGAVQIWLADCAGSGMKARFDLGAAHEQRGEAAGKAVTWLPRSEGSSVAEGIGIGMFSAPASIFSPACSAHFTCITILFAHRSLFLPPPSHPPSSTRTPDGKLSRRAAAFGRRVLDLRHGSSDDGIPPQAARRCLRRALRGAQYRRRGEACTDTPRGRNGIYILYLFSSLHFD